MKRHLRGTGPPRPLPEEIWPQSLALPSVGNLLAGQAAFRAAAGKSQLCLVFPALGFSQVGEGMWGAGVVRRGERMKGEGLAREDCGLRTTVRLPGRMLSSSVLGSHFLAPPQGPSEEAAPPQVSWVKVPWSGVLGWEEGAFNS